ncbi:hypothetical protein F5B20DRAFT_555181 [Whalleya microplaca]|nr:hypothetical protein F5B20DRAFT_555181 [Whalleya microplaca]
MASKDTSSNGVPSDTKARARSVIAYGQRQLNRVLSPTTRQKAYDSITSFAGERPLLFSFIALQLFLASTPLLLFTGFALCTTIFSLVCGIAFVLFWASIGLLFLLPTLFATLAVGTAVWAWGATTFIVGRWVYSKLPANARARNGGDGDSDKQVIFGSRGAAAGEAGGKRGFNVDNIKAEAAKVRD